jgi:hypothetical protein
VSVETRMSIDLSSLSEDQAVGRLQGIGKLLQDGLPKPVDLGITSPQGPYALYYHQIEVMTRSDDLALIAKRLFRNRSLRQQADQTLQSLRPHDLPPGTPWPADATRAHRAVDHLVAELRVDFETFFLLGAVLLDQWSFIVARLAGLPRPTELSFFPLVEEQLDSSAAPEPLAVLRRYKEAFRWLVFWFRHFRNDFIVHTKTPTQKGPITGGFEQDITLFMPTAVGWEAESELELATRRLTRLAPEWLRRMPDAYWEKQRWRRLLERIAENVGSLDRRKDRQSVAAVARRAGLATPRSQILLSVLARTISDSTPLVIEAAHRHLDRVDLGPVPVR